ncbi:KAP family P-loop NTPase fold protein [Alteromonas australica]|uniref:KAP family P-loop NTPase fold protein n=1 Tax=Alteromonas australica TaxID=589873 RepID=UPI0023532505|nr:P-loop NTPase fold protein [Alteromonas australica]
MHTIPHAVQDIPLGEGSDFKDEMLGLTRYALALTQFIVQCGTPMTIAIQGDWGTGKTSMMRLIESTLATDETVKVGSFWFNTWQYSQFSSNSSLLPLIFLESLTRQLKQRLDEKSSDMLKKVQGSLNTLKPFLFAAGRGVAYAATGGIATEVYDEARKQGGVGNTNTLALSDALSNLKRDLTMYVEKICVDEGLNRIVIFIDDLDRIRPESAIELLETLKLFVDIPKCVFVLALDISVVKKGVSAKFGTDEVDAEGRSFFDKIIQLPFQMPTVTYGAHIKTYLTRLLERSNYGNGMSDEGLTTCANLLITSIGTNPRSIKRLINVLSLMSISHNLDMSEDKLDLDGDEHNQLLLFGFTCFQIAYEPLFSLIYRTESLDFLLLDSLDWDNHEEDPHLTEFIRLIERAEADNKQPEAFLTLLANVVDEDGSGDFDDAEMHKVKRIAQGLQLTSVDDDDSSYSSSRAGTDEDRKNAISSYFGALLDDITQETFNFLTIPTLSQSKIKRDGDTTRFKIMSKAKTTNYSNAAFSFAISDTARIYDYPDTMSLVCEITVEDGDNIMMQYASGRRKAHRALNDICSEMEAVASQYEIDVHAHAYKSIIVIEKVIELTDDVEQDHHEVKQGLFELDQCLSELLGVE